MRFEVLRAGVSLPVRGTEGAAGFDLRASLASPVTLAAHAGRALVGTGLAMEVPYGHEVQIRPRSGLALKYGVTVLNAPGTVDSDYRGEVGVILANFGQAPFLVEDGMRIAQMVVHSLTPVVAVAVEVLSPSERGRSGFGSTGTR